MSSRAATFVSRSILGLTLVAIATSGLVAYAAFDDAEPGQVVVIPADREEAIAEAASLLGEDCAGQQASASLADGPSVYCDLRQRQTDGATFAPRAADPVTIVGLILGLLWLGTGSVIVTRQPRNVSGWVFHVVGLGLIAELLASAWVFVGIKAAPGSVPFVGAIALVTEYALITPILLPMLWLFFPDGHPPSERWRWPVRIYLGAVVLAVGAAVFSPGPLNNLVDLGMVYMNPLGLPALAEAGAILQVVGVATAMAITVSTVVGVRGRYRRARGDERQQLRWLSFVTTIAIASLVLMFVGGITLSIAFGEDNRFVNWWFPAWFLVTVLAITLGIPAAYLIAIFKHGLWDLDVVIRKAVIAIVLTMLMAGVGVSILLTAGRFAFYEGANPRVAVLVGIVFGLLFMPLLRLARRIAGQLTFGKRVTPYEVLTAFGERVGETYSTEDVLPRMAQLLANGTGASSARVLVRVGGDLRQEARWPEEAGDPGDEHIVPVVDRGEELGVLSVTMPASDPMNPSKEKLIADLAAQAGLVLRNVKLIEELRASRQRLVAAQDEERRKLERNIHDGAQQQLVALTVKLRLAHGLVSKDASKAERMLADLQSETQAALEDLRDLARGIYPPLLADQGLGAALEAQARKAAVPTAVNADGIGRFDQDVESAVYFCTLEALNNVAKYAEATSARVTLAWRSGLLEFRVTDDGRGFDPSATAYGTGLQGMADRLDAIGGSLEVRSEPGHGTRVVGSVPAAEVGAS